MSNMQRLAPRIQDRREHLGMHTCRSDLMDTDATSNPILDRLVKMVVDHQSACFDWVQTPNYMGMRRKAPHQPHKTLEDKWPKHHIAASLDIKRGDAVGGKVGGKVGGRVLLAAKFGGHTGGGGGAERS